jgi:hypothetical protein
MKPASRRWGAFPAVRAGLKIAQRRTGTSTSQPYVPPVSSKRGVLKFDGSVRSINMVVVRQI